MRELSRLQEPLDRIPEDIRCAQDYETVARQFLSGPVLEYIRGGSARETTLTDNRAVFSQWHIVPRLLGNLQGAHTRLRLPGGSFEHPLLLAPVAHQSLVHDDGELVTARGAAAMSAGMIVSTLSSQRLESIAAAAQVTRWFQLYIQSRQAVTMDLVRRAEAAAYSAFVVTLDATIQVPSYRAQRSGFCMPAQCLAANLSDYDDRPAEPLVGRGRPAIFDTATREAPSVSELDAVLASTRLPVWVKGVMHPDDACALKERGVAGIIVSNHGGRTIDGVPSSLSVLPLIRAAVGDDFPVLLDSGVRSGADAFKALALGADAVLIGRLQLYAASVAGALGVAHMLKLLREELEICMVQTGCASLAAIRKVSLMSRIGGIDSQGVVE